MQPNAEINALIQLLDDPDRQVFEVVSTKILDYGQQIVPNLEASWEASQDEAVQERIEELIHRVNFIELKKEITDWAGNISPNLLRGLFLMCKYRFSHIDENSSRKTLKSIYQSAWLELNNYLSPIEQINVINSIIYSMYKFTCEGISVNTINHFFINTVIESRKTNIISLGCLYIILCELLDIPVFAVNIPNQFILAFFDNAYDFRQPGADATKKILFYIDPVNGSVYTENDVEAYLKKIHDPSNTSFREPQSNKQIMLRYLNELIQCYSTNDMINEKEKELLELIEIIKESE